MSICSPRAAEARILTILSCVRLGLFVAAQQLYAGVLFGAARDCGDLPNPEVRVWPLAKPPSLFAAEAHDFATFELKH